MGDYNTHSVMYRELEEKRIEFIRWMFTYRGKFPNDEVYHQADTIVEMMDRLKDELEKEEDDKPTNR